MGDYSLSPAEIAALSLSWDAIHPESFFFLSGPGESELGALPGSDRPRQGIAPPAPADLAAIMELLPHELFSPLHQHVELAREEADGDEEPPDRPAARSVVEGLERVVVGAAEGCDRCCSICLEEMEVGGEARSLGCAHRYHEACIFEWLRRRSSCPLCRYQMPVG